MHKKLLFFSLNVDQQLNRQCKILEFLDTQQSMTRMHELAYKVMCSIPTLKNDLYELNDILPYGVKIKSYRKSGYYIVNPNNVSISTVIKKLMKDSDVYKIIDTLFHHQSYDFDKLVQTLDIKPSTLKNTLTHINQIISEYGISLSDSPFQFVGDETDIRLFLYSFYYDFNDYSTINTGYKDRHVPYQIIIEEVQTNVTPNLNICHFRIALWIMIIRGRIMANCYVHIDETLKEQTLNNPDYQAFSRTFISMFIDFFKSYRPPIDGIIWAYITIAHCISYSDSPNELSSRKTQEYVPSSQIEPTLIQSVNDFLRLEFEESLVQSHHLDKIRAFLINLSNLTQLSNQFQRITVSTRENLKVSLNEYYTLWMNHLSSLEALKMFPIYHPEDIAISLAMMHFSITSQLKKRPIRVLFAYQGEPAYGDYLTHQTQLMIPSNTEATFSYDEIISESLVRRHHADLVVTNYDLPESLELSCTTIQLAYVPTKSEWYNLGSTILSLSTHQDTPHYPIQARISEHTIEFNL